MMLSRRTFLAAAATGAALSGKNAWLKIGAMETVFRLTADPDSVRMAGELGLAAIQVTLGKSKDHETLPLEDPALQEKYRAASKHYGVPLSATYLDMLHVNCVKNDPLSRKWIEKGIDITKKLNAGTLMLVFFNKCSVLDRKELDYVCDVFREYAPVAARAGLTLAFENTLTAEENVYAFDRVASKAFKIWYDVGNSTYSGFDVPKEIRVLGRERIGQFHFKDKGYLGEGTVDFKGILKAVDDIGFEGYALLETNVLSGDAMADAKRNLSYLRGLMG